MLTLLLVPSARLGAVSIGDQQLADEVRQTLAPGKGLHSIAAARVEADGTVRHAGLGSADALPSPQTPFELGSITKTFTGSLLALAIERGEVTLDTTAGEHLQQLAGTEAGTVTLRELATHSSGIPSLPPQMLARGQFWITGGNPYQGVGTPTLLGWVAENPLTARGQFAYSNSGVSVLGHTLAAAAGTDYVSLLQERLLDPLGMDQTFIVEAGQPEPVDLARPHQGNGLRAAPWNGLAFAPAGTSTRTTTEDLGRYAEALMNGSAPESAAMDEIATIDDQTFGMLWLITLSSDQTITWHNGGTAGTSTVMAIDRQANEAVIVLSNQAESRATQPITSAGVALATRDGSSAQAAEPVQGPTLGLLDLLTPAIGLVFLTGLVVSVLQRRTPSRWKLNDNALWAIVGSGLILLGAPWALIPSLVWVAPVAATIFGITTLALRMHRGGRGPRWPKGWWSSALSIVVALVIGTVVAMGVWH